MVDSNIEITRTNVNAVPAIEWVITVNKRSNSQYFHKLILGCQEETEIRVDLAMRATTC